MAVLILIKSAGGSLHAADEATQEFVQRLKVGHQVAANFRQMRNPRFHRKMFALFKLAFDAWEAPAMEYKGEAVSKQFDGFRADLTILAGHYVARTNLKGEVRLEAKSLSFGSMDEEEFGKVYKDVLNVVWSKVLSTHGYSSAGAVDDVVERLLGFDA